MKAQLIVSMVTWNSHPITPYCLKEKERRGLGIFVKEETMETSVAKGMALNSEERN